MPPAESGDRDLDGRELASVLVNSSEEDVKAESGSELELESEAGSENEDAERGDGAEVLVQEEEEGIPRDAAAVVEGGGDGPLETAAERTDRNLADQRILPVLLVLLPDLLPDLPPSARNISDSICSCS